METDVLEKTEKTCRICKITKPVAEFHKDRTRGDGFKARCAACSSDTATAKNKVRKVLREQSKQSQDRKSVARVSALKRLVELHQRDFQKLLADEYVKVGVQPRWQSYVGDTTDLA